MGGLPIAGDTPAFDFRQITVDAIQQCFGEEKSTVRVKCLTDYVAWICQRAKCSIYGVFFRLGNA